MKAIIEKTCNGFIIALSDGLTHKLYFSGVKNGKNKFTLDYTYARTFKSERNAQLKAYDIMSDY